MPLRQHDIILAEGSFQVVLTNRRRLFAVINAPQTALGPMRIALEVDRRAFQEAMRLISQHMPFLPEGARKSIEAASRIVMRARLGDLTAKDFIKGVVSAVKAGVAGARKIGDALLTGSRLVAHVLDFPLRIMEHIPGLKGVAGFMQNLSPFAKFEKMTTLVQKGDFAGLKKMVT